MMFPAIVIHWRFDLGAATNDVRRETQPRAFRLADFANLRREAAAQQSAVRVTLKVHTRDFVS